MDSATNTAAVYAATTQGDPVLIVTQAKATPSAVTSASGMATAAVTAPAPAPAWCATAASAADDRAGPPGETRPGPAGRGGPCTYSDTLCGTLTGPPPPTPRSGGRRCRPAAAPRSGPRGPRRTRTA